MKRFSYWLFAVLVLSCLAMGVRAQTDDVAAGAKTLSSAEEKRLRTILTAPVPRFGNLHEHFYEKEVVAGLLGDEIQNEAVMRQAVKLLPGSEFKAKLAALLLRKGQFDEANELMQQAVATADPFNAAIESATIVCNLHYQNKNEAALAAISDATTRVQIALRSANNDFGSNLALRAQARVAYCLSLIEERVGHFTEAVYAAESAEQLARKAVAYTTSVDAAQKSNTSRNVATYIGRRLQAYRAAGRLQDAENVIAEARRYASEVQLPTNFLSVIYSGAGRLRFSQREFSASERLMRESDKVLEGIGWAPTHSSRTSIARDISNALVGQHKWQAALNEFDRLDRLAGDDPKLKDRVAYSMDRGVVYFGNQRYAEAALLFSAVAERNSKQYGDTHFFTAEAVGLQGASLWFSGSAENKGMALPLLKAAVRDYMAPVNADFLENVGYRKERRDEVFAAYLEAITSTPGDDAVQAIGAADWVRGSIVQESLNDAAVRSAASTPALANDVRREQDAKNEVAGIRRYLSGETGSANSPLPQVAAQLRERIAVLEGERVKLQAAIKTKFPDYDLLVRPTPLTAEDIARQLQPQQALLMVLPTPDAVYVWAIASDRPAAFVRAQINEAKVDALVGRLREQLDFEAGPQAGKQFDSDAAFTLYDSLLAPLASVWKGKTQLIVAAGGSLSQLPFAVLHTKSGTTQLDQAPWLIRDASITQVPSLSAWRAIKSIRGEKYAGKSFIGWGDPEFSSTTATLPRSGTMSRKVTLNRTNTLTDLGAPDHSIKLRTALRYADIPALPDTRDELLAIARILKADVNRDVLLGAKASRASVLAASQSGQLADKRVLAFATHGLMAGDLPNLTQPALAMAANGVGSDDPLAPLLTLDDVLSLKLNADWVVLSACNTAAANGRAGEALSGLARGFFYAGSRSLLVTHWAVESESAKLLTTATFQHYVARPDAPKAESLRQAMLKVMDMPQYAHPAFWAPYALVGDGGR